MSSEFREGRTRGNMNSRPLTAKPSTAPPAQRKASDCGKNLEIENLKRLLANISQRLDALKTI